MRKTLFFLSALLIPLVMTIVCLQFRGSALAAANDRSEIEALEKRYTDAVIAKDLNAIMSCYAPGDQLLSSTPYRRANTQAGKPIRKIGSSFSRRFPARLLTRSQNRA